ncbi:cupredoxin domain-containing protein [Synechococcus elongatus]|uniref:Cupredoxin domain-containing protein n=1 Tax=Synechococcus elongatus PCC 11802 TaxID=2283154 RepID=A0AAT9JMA1_SYNEL|nr:cupredoxin domain-containing protein [Synechococcus elongatus]QFZ92400.1 hypothetical protein EKO22_08610 [Synechococcus elongatus PCC 11802]
MTFQSVFLSTLLAVTDPVPTDIAITAPVIAARHSFQSVEQPPWAKTTVTGAGLALIGLELWWFLVRRTKSQAAVSQGNWQELTITVDGGYTPSHLIVQAGQQLRLNFDRRDPSHCLDEVRFPDFQIAQQLPINQVTAIEFTPAQPGQYEFTCGMAMFRGILEVRPAVTPSPS